MVKLHELYTVAGKIVVICDVIYDKRNGNLILYKENDNLGSALACDSEEVFLSIATRFHQPPTSEEVL